MQFKDSVRDVFSVGFVIASAAYFVLKQILGLFRDYLSSVVILKIIPLSVYNVVFLSILVVAAGILVYDKIIMRHRIKRETRIDIVRRKDLPQLSVLFKGASELHLVGITLQELQQATGTIKDVLLKNGRVRVLLCDPSTDNLLIPEIDKVVKSQETAKKISSTLATLDEIRKNPDLSSRQIANLELKRYRTIPTHTLLIVNPDSDSGAMQAEPYAYGIEAENRRLFSISKKKHKGMFEMYWNSYKNMWDDTTSENNR